MPDNEAAQHAGVRRLNKKPLVIVAVGLILIVAVVVQAIAKRSQAQKAAANSARPLERNAVIDSKNSVDSLTKDAPRGLIPEQEVTTKPVAPSLPGDELVQRQNDGVAAKETATEISIIPQNGFGNKAKSDEAAEERRRLRQARRQAYEAALNSPTTVNSGQVDTNADQNRTKQFPAPQSSASALSAMTDALNARVASLGAGAGGGLGPLGAAAGESDPNGQKSKNEFFKTEQTGKYGYLINTRQAALSAYEAKAGTVIPAVLVSGVNSDLPGMIIAQVSQDVYDTASGRHLLIPQGTKLLGSYDSMVTFGQNRAAVIWNKLTFPDASALFLGSMPGADQAGYSGFQDKVNHHYMRAFGSALLVSVFGAGIQLSQPNSSANNLRPTAQEELAAEVGRQMGQLGMEIARKNLNAQPTIEVRPGYRFVVMINKDLVLEPYSPKPPRLQTQ